MAIAIEFENKRRQPSHNCIDEIPMTDFARRIGPFRGVEEVKLQPIGQIVRCSCGRLWKTKKWCGNSYSVWKRAGLYLILKCWGKGYSESDNGY